jgi:Thiopurine S-methyltransferase (TPMT)
MCCFVLPTSVTFPEYPDVRLSSPEDRSLIGWTEERVLGIPGLEPRGTGMSNWLSCTYERLSLNLSQGIGDSNRQQTYLANTQGKDTKTHASAAMAAIRKDIPLEQARAALKLHFSEYPGEKYGEGWAKLWDDGNLLPWDRLKPSPALIDTLENYRGLIGGPLVEGRRKKALVPGCGRGVDVLLLQSFGYDAIGLDIATGAAEAAEEFAKEHESDYPVKDEKVGKGSRKVVVGDFFKDDFLKDAGLKDGEHFDLIYDYTVSRTCPSQHLACTANGD